MTTAKLRIGVIGCGAIGQIAHIPYLVDDDDKFELVVLSDLHQPTLDAVADHYHVAARYTDWHDLLKHEGLEAVVICHSGSHRDTTIAALEAGKHVFVEKPLTWNLREAEAVAASAAKSDRIVQLGYHKLYDPAFAYTKQQVHQMRDLAMVRITVWHPANELGLSPHRIRRGNGVVQEGHMDVGTLESQIEGQLRGFAGGEMAALVDDALGARKDNNTLRLGYGILCSSFIHQIYTLYGFLGAPTRVVSTNIWRSGLSIHVVVEYPNDVRCTLDWHFLNNLKNYHEEYAFVGNHDRVTMQLPSPYFLHFPSPVIVQGYDGELAWEKKLIVSYEEAFRNELRAFYDHVRTNQQPALSSIQDALEHARFIQQVIDTAE